MNQIEELRRRIAAEYPDAKCELFEPFHEDGLWALTIINGNRRLAVDWATERGFGVSELDEEVYGEGADEIIGPLNQTLVRVRRLLAGEQKASPPMQILLTRLRERRGLTQQQLAERLGVRQATISGLERRGDVQLSTLSRVVDALGGRLEVIGLFPEGEYVLASSGNPDPQRLAQVEEPTVKVSYRFEQLEQKGELHAAGDRAKKIQREGWMDVAA